MVENVETLFIRFIRIEGFFFLFVESVVGRYVLVEESYFVNGYFFFLR